MKQNKRPPKELAKYVVYVKETVNNGEGLRETFKYFQTQKDAKEFARGVKGKKYLFKAVYDFIGEL
jgi:hypothetical protein